MRDSYAHIKQAARGNWKTILEGFGVPPERLTGRACPCPVCGGTNRFRFDDKDGNGTFICNQRCRNSDSISGDGINLVQRLRGWDYHQTMKAIAGRLGLSDDYRDYHDVAIVAPRPAPKVVVPQRNQRATEKIEKVLARCVPVTNDTVTYRYLTETRGLPLQTVPRVIGHHPSLEYWEEDEQIPGKYNFIGNYPAMVALVSALNGELVNLHRTYLTHDAQQAFPKGSERRRSKKWMTPVYERATSGGAIRLSDPTDELGICEGVETGLACQLMTGIPVWSALSATGMKTIKIPSSVRRVVIFGDNDISRVGQEAAQELAERLAREGYAIEKPRIPAGAGEDWLEVFNKHTR